MTKPNNYIFVLWGEQFEETAAVVFVTKLREAGLRVKVVGLSRQQARGAHGLVLVPDLTLEQVLPLAAQTIALIIPCSLRIARRLKNDPRLRELFELFYANKAQIVIGHLNGLKSDNLGLFSLTCRDVTVYPGDENLIPFARELAGSLSTCIG